MGNLVYKFAIRKKIGYFVIRVSWNILNLWIQISWYKISVIIILKLKVYITRINYNWKVNFVAKPLQIQTEKCIELRYDEWELQNNCFILYNTLVGNFSFLANLTQIKCYDILGIRSPVPKHSLQNWMWMFSLLMIIYVLSI